ncbi:hypothetical protein [Dyadobacter sandarakinus]|uniref:Uncharacterized protein n=1 Tax=Dyadobacter sandarakinus TaxID=2747268 RepID=A0ABX7ID73_9BACT|nr:hypothetical protein [Dyadobacter sandarakinus]QRR03884.1 hypothetical protein HWI92_24715 [Dyadobacter sandarakinus]
MNFISNIIFYTGKLLFATILFVAMVISTIISLPFIGAGLIKDAVAAEHDQPDRTNLIQFCS